MRKKRGWEGEGEGRRRRRRRRRRKEKEEKEKGEEGEGEGVSFLSAAILGRQVLLLASRHLRVWRGEDFRFPQEEVEINVGGKCKRSTQTPS